MLFSPNWTNYGSSFRQHRVVYTPQKPLSSCVAHSIEYTKCRNAGMSFGDDSKDDLIQSVRYFWAVNASRASYVCILPHPSAPSPTFYSSRLNVFCRFVYSRSPFLSKKNFHIAYTTTSEPKNAMLSLLRLVVTVMADWVYDRDCNKFTAIYVPTHFIFDPYGYNLMICIVD